MKEKVYTFRHIREIKFLPGTLSSEQAKNKLIEAELSRGYIPINVNFSEVKYNHPTRLQTTHYFQVYCYSAYAGKKSAREIYAKLSKKIKEGKGGDIIKVN